MELNRCYWCGTHASLDQIDVFECKGYPLYYVVRCNRGIGCGATGPMRIYKKNAEKAWNSRKRETK